MKPKIKNPWLWVLTFFISIFLAWLSFYSFRLAWIAHPEEFITAMPTNAKKWADELQEKAKKPETGFIEDNFILIDTDEDQQIAREDSGENAKRIAITDRKKLAKLFNWLYNHDHDSLYSQIICDIQFNVRDSEDLVLAEAIHKLLEKRHPSIIFAGEFDKDSMKYKPSIFEDINLSGMIGNTSYNLYEEEGFLEYSLSGDDLKAKSLPLVLYEKMNKDTAKDATAFGFINHETLFEMLYVKGTDGIRKRVWNNYVPEMIYKQKDLDNIKSFETTAIGDSAIAKIRLGNATALDGDILKALCLSKKSRIIFIGSFSGNNDMHKTMYGQSTGALILLNIYFNLCKGKNDVNLGFLGFLFCVFFLIAFDVVFRDYRFPKNIFFGLSMVFFLVPLLLLMSLGGASSYFKRMSKAAINWIREKSHYFVLLLAGMIANFCFDKLINIIIIAFAVFILDNIFAFAGDKKHVHSK